MTGRPQETEAEPYYQGYIQQVQGDDALAAMNAQLEEIMMLLGAIPEEKSLYRYAPEKWSIRQVLGHISDAERAFAFRLMHFARGFDAPVPGFDQEISAAGAESDRVSWSDLVEEFRWVRLSTIALVKNLPPEAWDRNGIASEKSFTVRSLAFIIPGHAAHHMKIVRERYV